MRIKVDIAEVRTPVKCRKFGIVLTIAKKAKAMK
jgi:hypothetical protein